MQLPIKAHYATVAMLDLAQNYQCGQLLTVRAMADEHDIPPQFLVQILQQLRAAGMITSTRGSSGGFRLERAPARISVAEIVEAVCPISSTPTLDTNSTLNQIVRDVWDEVNERESQLLSQIKLSDLCASAEKSSQTMFYI
ncbi:MAG: Rrf2 family transcriptional regulator [Pirellulaceae bacterium]|nr:Rrf2 family transcriptional regulator [Pirellulaceae bacterium]